MQCITGDARGDEYPWITERWIAVSVMVRREKRRERVWANGCSPDAALRERFLHDATMKWALFRNGGARGSGCWGWNYVWCRVVCSRTHTRCLTDGSCARGTIIGKYDLIVASTGDMRSTLLLKLSKRPDVDQFGRGLACRCVRDLRVARRLGKGQG